MNIGTSYRPISLLSVIAKTLEKTLLPYITNNIPHIPTQHGFKSNHSTSTAPHNINNTIATGFNQNKPPERTITVALDMSKAFDTVNIHTLSHKLHQTNIPYTIIKYIANYIKGRKGYTTFRNKTSTQRQFKNGVPQGGVLSPKLFNKYTSDTPTPQAPVKLTTSADDITITSTHTDINIAKANIQSYLHEIHTWTRTNNLILNPEKTTCNLFTPDPAEYSTQLELQLENITLPMNINPKLLGLTLDPKLTYNKHIKITTTKARKRIQILKALTSQHGETKGNDHSNIQCYNKTHTRVRFHHMVTTSIRHKHQQTTDNTKHRTQNSNWVYNRHKYTTSTRRNTHSAYKGTPPITRITDKTKAQQPTHPLHYITKQQTTPRRTKQTTYNNTYYTTNINTNPNTIDDAKIKTNMEHIHTNIVNTYLNNRQHNKITNTIPLTVYHSETTLPRATRRTLAQLRTNKCPLLHSYLNKIDKVKHPSPLCLLCKTEQHTYSTAQT